MSDNNEIMFSAKDAQTLSETSKPNVTPIIKWCNAIIRQQAQKGHSDARDFYKEMKQRLPSVKELTAVIEHYTQPSLGFSVECDGKDFKTLVIKWN